MYNHSPAQGYNKGSVWEAGNSAAELRHPLRLCAVFRPVVVVKDLYAPAEKRLFVTGFSKRLLVWRYDQY
jgi:hypothetical protein